MQEGPPIATIAALLGDPARANMVSALMDGRALTGRELALTAGVTPQTASAHLSQLVTAGLLTVAKQGRCRYFRLATPEAAQMLETLMGLAQHLGASRIRPGPRDTALRSARVCYDHFAGERAVGLFAALRRQHHLTGEQSVCLTASGRDLFSGFGIDVAAIEGGRRTACRPCLDWSERRPHLGGALGAALLSALLARHWLTRGAGRLLTLTQAGEAGLRQVFGA